MAEVGDEFHNLSNELKKEFNDQVENSTFAAPNAIMFFCSLLVICTILGGLAFSYIRECNLAKKALADEIHKIERTATNNYKKMLLSDEYCSGIIELGISNIKQHRENWQNPDKTIEELESILQEMKKREKKMKKTK